MKISTNTHSLSIGRHSAQFILHSAIAADPLSCHGLIGTIQNNIPDLNIQHAELISNSAGETLSPYTFNDSDLTHMLKKWADQGITCCGSFTSSPSLAEPHTHELKILHLKLSTLLPTSNPAPLFHLFTSLNTKGCLETFAYQFENDICIPTPLLLIEDTNEDGQQPSRS